MKNGGTFIGCIWRDNDAWPLGVATDDWQRAADDAQKSITRQGEREPRGAGNARRVRWGSCASSPCRLLSCSRSSAAAPEIRPSQPTRRPRRVEAVPARAAASGRPALVRRLAREAHPRAAPGATELRAASRATNARTTVRRCRACARTARRGRASVSRAAGSNAAAPASAQAGRPVAARAPAAPAAPARATRASLARARPAAHRVRAAPPRPAREARRALLAHRRECPAAAAPARRARAPCRRGRARAHAATPGRARTRLTVRARASRSFARPRAPRRLRPLRLAPAVAPTSLHKAAAPAGKLRGPRSVARREIQVVRRPRRKRAAGRNLTTAPAGTAIPRAPDREGSDGSEVQV